MESNTYRNQEQQLKWLELPYNKEATLNLQNNPIYSKYKDWLRQNGVLLDHRIQYPSYFGIPPNGIVGISANRKIQRKTAVIAVPYSLLITVDKVKQDDKLKFIIKHFLDKIELQDISLEILLLYVIYEMLKGQQSFYFPYFQICSQNYVQGSLDKSSLKIQHRGFMRQSKIVEQQIQNKYIIFYQIFKDNKNLLQVNFTNLLFRQIFEKAYYLVITRVFGSLPTTSLIPLADSLNHSNTRFLNHFLTNIGKDIKHPQLSKHTHINLMIFQNQYFGLNQQELAKLQEEPSSKITKFNQRHKQILMNNQQWQALDYKQDVEGRVLERKKQYYILHKQYKSGKHRLKQLHFYQSSCSQDNDTDDDQIQKRQNRINNYQTKYSSRLIRQKNKLQQIQKFWNIYYDDYEEAQQTSNSSEKVSQTDLSSSSSQKDSGQDQYEWLDNKNNKQTYFVMNTNEQIRQNEQLYNFYGRRSNKFLLLGYNFIMKDNIYDSFGFKIKLDSKINSRVTPHKLVEGGRKEDQYLSSRQIRLKRFRINKGLIDLCRSYVILWSNIQQTNCKICIPFSRQVQIETLELYRQFIDYFISQYTTTISQDEQQQNRTNSIQQRLAVSLKIQYKKILFGQLNLIQKCISFLNRWKVRKIQQLQYSQMIWIKRIKQYLLQLQAADAL